MADTAPATARSDDPDRSTIPLEQKIDHDGCISSESPTKHARTDDIEEKKSTDSSAAPSCAAAPSVKGDFDFDLHDDDRSTAPPPTSRRNQQSARARMRHMHAAVKMETDENDDSGTTAEGAADPTATVTPSLAPAIIDRTPRCILIHSFSYGQLLDRQSIHAGRMARFSSLLASFQAPRWPNMIIHPPRYATMDEMTTFHSHAYIDAIAQLVRKLQREETADSKINQIEGGVVSQVEPYTDEERELVDRFGLKDDCALFPEAFDLLRASIGGTLRAAEEMMDTWIKHNKSAPVTAIHWGGGRHHAEAEQARGFCFGGDIPIGILALQSKLAAAGDKEGRILYLDLDVHHGDGVESAFAGVASVLTCSFHHRAPGFFPLTGDLEPNDTGGGVQSVSNVPLHEGMDDATFCALVDAVLSIVLPSFRPSAVVVCCGVDGLATDALCSAWNLTTRAYAKCVRIIKKKLGHYGTTSSSKQQAQTDAAAMTPSNAPPTNSSSPSDDATPAPSPSSSSPPSASIAVAPVPLPTSDLSSVASVEDASSFDSSQSSVTPTSTPVVSDSEGPIEERKDQNETVSTPPLQPPQPSSPPCQSTALSATQSYPTNPIPLLLLGGGGYNPVDSARAFLCMTASAASVQLPPSIPDTDRYYPDYLQAGQCELHSKAHSTDIRPNRNRREELARILHTIKMQCSRREAAEQSDELIL